MDYAKAPLRALYNRKHVNTEAERVSSKSVKPTLTCIFLNLHDTIIMIQATFNTISIRKTHPRGIL